MTHLNSHNDDDLEPFFRAAKDAVAEPGTDLMDRILQDAAAVQAGFVETAPAPASVPGPGLWAGILDSLGGWRGVSALTACAFVGLWIGFAAPGTIRDLSAGLVAPGEVATLDYNDLFGLQELLVEI